MIVLGLAIVVYRYARSCYRLQLNLWQLQLRLAVVSIETLGLFLLIRRSNVRFPFYRAYSWQGGRPVVGVYAVAIEQLDFMLLLVVHVSVHNEKFVASHFVNHTLRLASNQLKLHGWGGTCVSFLCYWRLGFILGNIAVNRFGFIYGHGL